VRTFEEKMVLSCQLAAQERAKGEEGLADRFEDQAAQAEQYASLILRHVLNGNGGGNPLPPPVQNMEP